MQLLINLQCGKVKQILTKKAVIYPNLVIYCSQGLACLKFSELKLEANSHTRSKHDEYICKSNRKLGR